MNSLLGQGRIKVNVRIVIDGMIVWTVKMGCRVDYAGPRGISPLMWAAKRGHIDMAELLLSNGADLLKSSEDNLGKPTL